MKKYLPLLLLLSACASKPITPPPQPTDKVSVMTFNTENLFEIGDERPKNDEAFMPAGAKTGELFANKCRAQNMKYREKKEAISADDVSLEKFRVDECLGKDYSPRIIARKNRRMADVVAQVGNGRGPDVLILQEVENRKAVEDWNETELKAMGYSTLFHLESPDERGIDTAILTRLPAVGEPMLHEIDFSKVPEIKPDKIRPTRGILEGRVRLPNGETLAIFALHFPSQGAPSANRKAALLTLLDVTSKVPAGTHVVVGGDFNITSREDWSKKYFQNLLAPKFAVSHLDGCEGCVGTTYYREDNTWSFFDVLLFSKNMTAPNSTWKLDTDSIRIVNSSIYQVDEWGKPAKFRNGRGSIGVSDHWPVYAEIHLNPAQTVGVQ